MFPGLLIFSEDSEYMKLSEDVSKAAYTLAYRLLCDVLQLLPAKRFSVALNHLRTSGE